MSLTSILCFSNTRICDRKFYLAKENAESFRRKAFPKIYPKQDIAFYLCEIRITCSEMFATNPQIYLFASTIVSGDKTELSCEGRVQDRSSLLNNAFEQRCDYDNHQT